MMLLSRSAGMPSRWRALTATVGSRAQPRVAIKVILGENRAYYAQNGLVYPCGDALQLRASLEQLRGDEGLRRRMAEASELISDVQDVGAAARVPALATRELYRLGPR
jgi:hypothetical protein